MKEHKQSKFIKVYFIVSTAINTNISSSIVVLIKIVKLWI